MYPAAVDRLSTLSSASNIRQQTLQLPPKRLQRQEGTEDSKDDFYKFANMKNAVASPSSLPSPPPALYRTASTASNAPIINDNTDQVSVTSISYQPPISNFYSENQVPDTPVTADPHSKELDNRYRRASHLFLAISVFSALLILVFECYIYAVINIHKKKFNSKERYAEILIYLSLFIFAAFYQVLLTIIGLKTKNMLLLAMLCIFYGCMLIYTGIQFEEVGFSISNGLSPSWQQSTRGTNIATIVVIALTLVSQVYMIFGVLRKNVKWFRYKKIGGDLHIKKMYTIFQIHRALLIFDFFFFIGFTVQFIVIMIANKKSLEFILTVCVLPLTILVLFASDFATTREIKLLTICTISLFLMSCAYVLFKIIRLYTKYSSAYNIGVTPGSYFPGRKSLVTFGIITLILLLLTVTIECIMLKNYNHGLLPLVSTYYSKMPFHNDNNAVLNEYWNKHNISMTTMNEKQSTKLSLPPRQTPATAPQQPNGNPTQQNYNHEKLDSDDESLVID